MRHQASRREFVTLATIAGLSLFGPKFAWTANPESTVSADEALKMLMEGNDRFAKGHPTGPRRTPDDFRALAAGQHPKAAILTCADSRVAPEVLFDVGLGDIFVVRVAGNVVTGAGPMVNGSIEYAVAELKVPLIVVLGHSACGAVKAAVETLHEKDVLPGSINGMVELVKPAVVASQGMPGNALDNAISKNVELGVTALQTSDPIVAPLVRDGKIKVVGGVYDLASGTVNWQKK